MALTWVQLQPDATRISGTRSSLRLAEADVEQALSIVADVARQHGLEPLTPMGDEPPPLAAYRRQTPRPGLVLVVDLYKDGRVLAADTCEMPARAPSERALSIQRSLVERFERAFGRHRVSTEMVK